MKNLLIAFCLLFIANCASSQTARIVADSTRLYSGKVQGNELILENSTRTVPGFLYNYGANGRTRFERPSQLNDTAIIIGIDTFRIHDPDGASGAGSVTDFSSGNLSPLFTITVTNSTTTPALSFTLSNAAAGTYFGNNTGSSAAPAFVDFNTSARAAISLTTTGTSGAATYNSSTGVFNIPNYTGLLTDTSLWERSSFPNSWIQLKSARVNDTVRITKLNNLGYINIPTSASTAVGVINQNNVRFIHSWGVQNYFMGSAVGPNFTAGSSTSQGNVGIGNAIMANLTTGYNNVGINGLTSITTGGNNVGIGNSSGTAITTGIQNTGVGVQALSNITTPNSNTALGFRAGFSTTGAGGVYLGAFAGDGDATAGRFYLANAAVSTGNNPMWGSLTTAQFQINGGNSPTLTASAQLEIKSTTMGFLPPRMTTTQRDAIASPAEGLHIYNLTTHQGNYYNGTSWVAY